MLQSRPPARPAHYYGDIVRTLFISAGVIMVVAIPFFTNFIPKPYFFSILAVLVVVLLSGLISPSSRRVVEVSTLVSAFAFIIFEGYAVNASQEFGVRSGFFIVNQILALIYLVAIYYCTKSLRGFNEKPVS